MAMKSVESVKFKLEPSMFTEREHGILESSSFSINSFRYRSGVEALRIRIGRADFIWLPYLGQQIWDWCVDGKSLKFEGFIEEPSYDKNFLQNYGGFLIHCGMTAMGNPGPDDTHLHHGELPVARFDEAWIELTSKNAWENELSLCGHIHWKVPFFTEYHCTSSLRISANGLRIRAEVQLANPTSRDLPYMYLAHINFGFAGADRILSTVPFDSSHAVIREDAVSSPFTDPSAIKKINQEAPYEPELVAILKHSDIPKPVGSILLYNDGTARWVSQESPELDHHVVWITHNQDRGALGFHLPSTAGPTGYANEKAKGNIKYLSPTSSITLCYDCGFADKIEDVPFTGAY